MKRSRPSMIYSTRVSQSPRGDFASDGPFPCKCVSRCSSLSLVFRQTRHESSVIIVWCCYLDCGSGGAPLPPRAKWSLRVLSLT